MARFHFVEDYERHVAHLLATHPVDEAMSLAVGGSYEYIGAIERDLLLHTGLRNGMKLIDLGCGSGRLAHAVSRAVTIEYLGIDIVQALLDYARTKTPHGYQFILHRDLSIPAEDDSADFLAAFSVFTHLLHAETYIYLEEARRVLKPAGRIVFSFLEFAEPDHWSVFEGTVASLRSTAGAPINSHIERPVIEVWCHHLNLVLERFIGANEAPWGGSPLGQAIAILRKPGT
jgi:ubiquinone/menaquinone biosynthesis C-methylase UbiE